jgi:hypothetical protein
VSEEELQRAVADERRRIATFLRAWARMNTAHGGPKTVSITLETAASAIANNADQEELPPWIDEEPNPFKPTRTP